MTSNPGTPYRLSFVVRTDEDPSQLLDMLEQLADNFVADLEPIEWEDNSFKQQSKPSKHTDLTVEHIAPWEQS